jgi:rhamnulokinase
MKRVAAVDLGASSGRVMLGEVGPDLLRLTEVNRFWNGPVDLRGALHWDILHLYRSMLDGLRAAGAVDSLGIDSWAVDYGLLDATGQLLSNPFHYRDSRTRISLQEVPVEELYQITGLQQLPINTLYQLKAERLLEQAETLLLIPDLLAYWLTGVIGAERTNASTTQLYDVRRRAWSVELAQRVAVPARLLPQLWEPGDVIGDYAGTPVIAVGSHDTASAVVSVPASEERFAYISSGTWSLVGLELDAPVLTEQARLANFTNEGGVDGRIRFLRNVMGLWILQECQRVWQDDDLPRLLDEAAAAPPFALLIDPDAPEFLAPGDMPARIGDAPKGVIVRCVLESLALAYRRTLRSAQELADRPVDVLHVIGGGSQNELLCQLTADACGLPVLAGPVEASALGNVLVQARALGEPLPDLAAMRALVRSTHRLRRYEPQGKPADWDAAESRVFGTR